MQQIYPGAIYRPLGDSSSEPNIIPRIFIAHTMVGSLWGTDSFFRSGNGAGYSGAESTWGVGGPWDGADNDGKILQWQVIGRQADAQYDGNWYANSLETSDGGDPSRPWSDRMVANIIELGAWWCKQTGRPARLVKSSSESGFGYHAQFPEWNKSSHNCPGSVRLSQFVNHVIPGIARKLGSSNPSLGDTGMFIFDDPHSAAIVFWDGKTAYNLHTSDEVKGLEADGVPVLRHLPSWIASKYMQSVVRN